MSEDILEFQGEHRWLSNFTTCRIVHMGIVYPSVENAYQAQKATDWETKRKIAGMTAGQAKRFARQLPLRDDWEQVKVKIMLDLLRKKFAHSYLRDKLLATGDAQLIEGNSWGDTFWGVCRGEGENMLGKLLMQVREEIRSECDCIDCSTAGEPTH